MQGVDPHSVQCRPIIFGAIKNRGLTLALCGGLIALFGWAGKVSAQTPTTLDRSSTPEAVAPPNLPLELRGIVLDETGSFFGFYNLKNGRSTWIALGKPMDGFVVRSYDEGSDWITAEFEGHTFTMALKKTLNVETGLTAPPPSPATGNEALRSEILHRKVLRLRSQKARLEKILKK